MDMQKFEFLKRNRLVVESRR